MYPKLESCSIRKLERNVNEKFSSLFLFTLSYFTNYPYAPYIVPCRLFNYITHPMLVMQETERVMPLMMVMTYMRR